MRLLKPILITLITATGCGLLSILLTWIGENATTRQFIDISFYTSGVIFVTGIVITGASIIDFLIAPPSIKRKSNTPEQKSALFELSAQQKDQDNSPPSNIVPVTKKLDTVLGVSITLGSSLWWGIALWIYSRLGS